MNKETTGVYEIIKYFKENGASMMRMKCRECGAIKDTKVGNKRHFSKTKFCRSCPPRVRAKVYGETWQIKTDKKVKERSLSEEELESRKQWNDIFRKISRISTTPT